MLPSAKRRLWLLAASVLLLTGCPKSQGQPVVTARAVGAPAVVAPTVVAPRAAAVGASFVMFSDAQQAPVIDKVTRGGPRERAWVRERIRALSPELILFGGDAVGFGTYKPFWDEFRRDYGDMTIYPVIGNHDLMGPNRRALEYFFGTFPHLQGARWYKVRFGPVQVLMLDSNRGSLGKELWAAQLRWLDAELEAARTDQSVRLVMLVSHYPPMSTSSGGGKAHVFSDFYGRASANPKFKLYLSGHHHCYQHIVHSERHVLVAGGGGGPLYYHQSGALPADARLAAKHYAHHVVRGVVEQDRLRVEVHTVGEKGGWTVPEVFYVPL
jgi:3',5'-cyclic AMP phosphodiesterase CpdA